MNNGKLTHDNPRNQKTRRTESERATSTPSSRRSFTVKAAGVFAGLILAAIAADPDRFSPSARAKLIAPPAPPTAAVAATTQNLGSPDFANPNEVRANAAAKRLRMVMTMINGEYMIPNVGTAMLRQYRGWDAAQAAPNLSADKDIAPGPTLRARLGDTVEISYLNKIDDSKFAYTFDTNSKPGRSSFGCDQSGTIYPGKDLFPNCFHGSSTANIHFHGTHVSPDGLGDNVLVQVMPQANQKDWLPTFNKIFNSGKVPQEWKDMPENYREEQMDLIKKHDDASAAAARKNGLLPPGSLYEANKQMIDAGEWPQYIMGAFPNFFRIPDYSSGQYKAGQAPGTHWYHAHKHGSTSLHILNGLAGAFVIESSQEGGYDHVIRKFYGWGNSYGEHEKILVFQQYDPTQNLERGGPGGKGIKQVLVNGKLTPTITMLAGDVQLWRFINATVGNKAGIINDDLFDQKGFTFKQTAQDGVQFSRDNYQNQPYLNPAAVGGQVPNGLTLAGGNRADLLVQAPKTAGVYTFQSGGTTLFFVKVVAGSPVSLPNGAFPSKTQWAEMPRFLRDLPKPGPKDEKNPNSPVKFQWEAGRVQAAPTPSPSPGSTNNDPPHFMINNKQFGETGEIVDQCMPLNGLQDWVLENWTSVAHPFHIHINPFQIIQIDTPTALNKYTTYKPPKEFIWQDVIAIPPGKISKDGKQITPGKVTIRQTYLDFTGTYVLHCHILAHEDRGMMQLVRVVPADKYPGQCQNAVPDHH